jgi:large subunit ribosomal protein L29
MAFNKDLSNEEMLGALKEAEDAYVRAKFDHAVTPMNDPSLLGKMRKDIARMQTELRSRELAAATPEELARRSKIRLRRRLNN